MKTISRYIMTLALLITAVTGAWAADTYTVAGNNAAMFGSGWDPTYTANDMTKNGDGTYSITYTNVYLTGNVEYKVVKDHSWSEAYPNENRVINIAEAGTYTVTIHFNPTTHEVYETMPGSGSGEPDVEVTTNAASEGATFTEATFAMPAFDATAEYELVRDIATGVRALVNNGAERIYVTKVENKFVPKEAITYKLTDVLDQNNQFDLTEGTDYQKVGLHILDGSTWKDVTDESDLKPGTYEMIFEGLGKYDGKVYSQEFLLSNGYELTIDAGEYATFYHNEKVSIEDSDAEIYTIANVSTTEAVLSEKMEVAAAETPLLVYNAGSETKTFLLIPTDDEASEVLVAAEFRGTLAAKDMPASSTNMDYYVCTGKAFTWVRDAGQIAANRCWLQIGANKQPAATRSYSRAITRGLGGIDGTTGIDAVENGEVTNEGYYDLNGRKVANPKRGGIYIHNGKKVIIH